MAMDNVHLCVFYISVVCGHGVFSSSLRHIYIYVFSIYILYIYISVFSIFQWFMATPTGVCQCYV